MDIKTEFDITPKITTKRTEIKISLMFQLIY